MYADQTAVLGPLATYAEPHAYDLCASHSERLSAPRGWEVLRLRNDREEPGPSTDDLLALADAVREAAQPAPAQQTRPEPVEHRGIQGEAAASQGRETGRRGHLRVLSSE